MVNLRAVINLGSQCSSLWADKYVRDYETVQNIIFHVLSTCCYILKIMPIFPLELIMSY